MASRVSFPGFFARGSASFSFFPLLALLWIFLLEAEVHAASPPPLTRSDVRLSLINAEEYLEQGRYGRASRVTRRLLEAFETLEPEAQAHALYYEALARLGRSDYPGALKCLEALANSPYAFRFPELALHLGQVHALLGNSEAARAAWKQALAIEQTTAAARAALERLEAGEVSPLTGRLSLRPSKRLLLRLSISGALDTNPTALPIPAGETGMGFASGGAAASSEGLSSASVMEGAHFLLSFQPHIGSADFQLAYQLEQRAYPGQMLQSYASSSHRLVASAVLPQDQRVAYQWDALSLAGAYTPLFALLHQVSWRSPLARHAWGGPFVEARGRVGRYGDLCEIWTDVPQCSSDETLESLETEEALTVLLSPEVCLPAADQTGQRPNSCAQQAFSAGVGLTVKRPRSVVELAARGLMLWMPDQGYLGNGGEMTASLATALRPRLRLFALSAGSLRQLSPLQPDLETAAFWRVWDVQAAIGTRYQIPGAPLDAGVFWRGSASMREGSDERWDYRRHLVSLEVSYAY